MELAKQCLDVGLYTNRYEELRAFYVDQLGLAYEELLKVGGGVHQHRLAMNGSVLKLNSARDPLADGPTNLLGFDIGMAVSEASVLTDPDGTKVGLMPSGSLCIHWASSDPARLTELLVQGMGAVIEPNDTVRIGTTTLALHGGGVPVGPLRCRGMRYLTVQVRDVRTEHARLVGLGWREQLAPVKLGETAFISFVTDPDGTPIEISQRASLTGPLPVV